MGAGSSKGKPTNEVPAANGVLRKGTRCQTQYERSEGGDDRWYVATVEAVYDSGKASLIYDDGDKWTGKGVYIYVLPPGHPGLTQKVAMGANTQAGPPGLVQSVAQPVMPQQPQMIVLSAVAAVPGGQSMIVNDPKYACMHRTCQPFSFSLLPKLTLSFACSQRTPYECDSAARHPARAALSIPDPSTSTRRRGACRNGSATHMSVALAGLSCRRYCSTFESYSGMCDLDI